MERKLTRVEVAQILGQLVKLGLITPIRDDRTTRYQVTGRPVDQGQTPRHIPAEIGRRP
jgi:predicted transcriptional regulator